MAGANGDRWRAGLMAWIGATLGLLLLATFIFLVATVLGLRVRVDVQVRRIEALERRVALLEPADRRGPGER